MAKMTYEFVCDNKDCLSYGRKWSIKLQIDNRDEPQPCPQCGKTLRRVLPVIPKHGSWSNW